MDQATKENGMLRDGLDLDWLPYLKAILKRLWVVVLATAGGAGVTLIAVLFLITPTYESHFAAYINNRSSSQSATTLTSSDTAAMQSLGNTYAEIVASRSTLEQAAEKAGAQLSYAQLKKAVTTGISKESGVLTVSVVLDDPELACRLAESLAEVTAEAGAEVVEGSSMQLIDEARVPEGVYSPNYLLFTALGALAGAALSCAMIALGVYLDDRIFEEELIEKTCHIPVLGSIPDLIEARHISGSDTQKRKTERNNPVRRTNSAKLLLMPDSPFAAREAYKTLRTNVMFSLPGTGARCIGISSADPGDGKSTNALNLAITFVEIGKKVILIDCDMRLPTVAGNLGMPGEPGLSNLIAGQSSASEVIRHVQKYGMDVIPAGQVTPDPTSLLASRQMSALLHELRRFYDYIFLDFPPITTVSDALIVSGQLDGYLLVVRHGKTEKRAINEMMRSLRLADARALGVIYAGRPVEEKKYYGRYHYYGNYYADSADAGRKK